MLRVHIKRLFDQGKLGRDCRINVSARHERLTKLVLKTNCVVQCCCVVHIRIILIKQACILIGRKYAM